MSLETKINEEIKRAMKEKNTIALESLRAVKSVLLLAKTESKDKSISPDNEVQIIQKLIKQRSDSATLYTQQSRQDLADVEQAQIVVLEQFLPKQLSDSQIKELIKKVISEQKATSMKDMGRIMGISSKIIAGKADGKRIANAVKELLS